MNTIKNHYYLSQSFFESPMKKLIVLSSILFAAHSYAHQPYVSTLVPTTENSRTPIIAGYAEETLNSEAALKKAVFTIVDPDAKSSQITPESQLKSATVFDLDLPKDGTYKITSSLGYPIKYALYNKEWHMYLDMPADKAPKQSAREYVIPSDFKKAPSLVEVQREWTIQSYITKKHTTEVKETEVAPRDVTFSVHPNQIKVNQDVTVHVHVHDHAKNEHIEHAIVSITPIGESDDKAKSVTTNAESEAVVRFDRPGQYLLVASQKFNPKVKPTTQYYTIVSLHIAN